MTCTGITGDANIHDRDRGAAARQEPMCGPGMKRIIYRRNSTMGNGHGMIPTAARRQIWEMLGVELGGPLD
ncbi:hypothetical protein [Rhizobium phage RHEph15]|nr:hypothetical protein [Rhizobium phage RHEph15]